MFKKALLLFFISIFTVFLSKETLATNLVINGDFESGNTGFTTDYSLHQEPGSGPGIYSIIANAMDQVPEFYPSMGDHTTGNGLMMYVDSSLSSGDVVWSQIINIESGTDYILSTWMFDLHDYNHPTLEFFINDVLIGTLTYSSLETWNYFSGAWNSGDYTAANVSIYSQSTLFCANDFLLDDISFIHESDNQPVPEPATMILLGTGLVGSAACARRRMKK